MTYLDLLKEYHEISDKLNSHKVRAVLLKEIAQEQLNEVESEKEKQLIVARFENVLNSIKNDTKMRRKSNLLKERKRDIEKLFKRLDDSINEEQFKLKHTIRTDRAVSASNEKILKQNEKDLSNLQFKYINVHNSLRIDIGSTKKRNVGKLTNRIIKNNSSDKKVKDLFNMINSV